MSADYPIIEGSLRPFRLMVGRDFLRGRNYGLSLNAHKAAAWEVNFLKVGQTVEVVSVDDGRLLGSYTKKAKGVLVYWAPGQRMSWKALKG